MAENTPETSGQQENGAEKLSLQEQIGLSAKTPLGLCGIGLTTACIVLTLLGVIAHMSGMVSNPYTAIVTFLVFPAGIICGLLLIPLSGYFRRKKWFGGNINKGHVVIDFNKKNHRKTMVLLLVLSIVNVVVFSLLMYEAYHFAESDYFCGAICHTVMMPEYTAYQRSPHSKVGCVSCHIGSGAEWFVKAKISGLRQVKGVITGDYSRPIATPVHNMRPAHDTCGSCHNAATFHDKTTKQFVSFKNDSQEKPQVQDIALHLGGKNPATGTFEGIHWHADKNLKIEYQVLDEKRTSVGDIKVSRADGTTETYIADGKSAEAGKAHWRTMDCIDCHNRPTHIYDDPQERVDFGLKSKKIDPTIAGIREDSLEALKKEYKSRDEAKKQIGETLMALQTKRHGAEVVTKNQKALAAASAFLVETYLGNIWPDMKITWGAYKSHLGHQDEGEGFGCFRCHDDEHQTKDGKAISQSCDLCHDEP
ncbi:MAG: NapC/NirT family cytochrome c [Desulforhopalus sp.]|nr:NapC/NirT family cytochrome c [Desulforhopalus sp.]